MPDNDQIASIAEAITDSTGAPYDPEIHASARGGGPSYQKDGKFRKRRGAGSGARTQNAGAEFEERRAAAEDGFDPSTLGVAVSRSFITLCMMVGGPAYKPADAEAAAMDAAWAQYFEARSIDYIPPEFLLGSTLLLYITPRYMATHKDGKAGGFMNFVRTRILRRRAQNAYPDLRTNGERENESSDEPIETVSTAETNGRSL